MQEWMNVLRAGMLRIRRQKAKEAAARKRAAVEGAAQESQQAQAVHREQQQALANAALTTAPTSSSSSSHAYASSYNEPSSLAAQPNPNLGAVGMTTQSSEDKYTGE
jgi:hypothetical protein